MLPRKLMLLPVLALALCTPGHGQDSQSLGDVARQTRNNKKSGAQPSKVITNDDLPSASAASILGLGKPADALGSGQPGIDGDPLSSLSRLESVLKQLDSIDRGTLLKLALSGANPDFPGHDQWENRLLTAKQTYVTEGLGLIQRAKQLFASAQSLKSAQAGADDPRVKELGETLKEIIQESVRADAAFQAVILEGRDMARQASAR